MEKRRRGRPPKSKLQPISVTGSTVQVLSSDNYVSNVRDNNMQSTENLLMQVKGILANELFELTNASNKRSLTATEARNLNKFGYLIAVILREEREVIKMAKGVEDKEILSMIASSFGVDKNSLEKFLSKGSLIDKENDNE